MHHRSRSSPSGVTLIELIVALGLAAALLGAVIVFVGDLSRAREHIERASNRDRAIDAFMDVVEGAVATSVLDAGDGAFVGDTRSCTIRSAAVDPVPAISPEGRPFTPTTMTWISFDAEAGALLVRRGTGASEPLPIEGSALRLRYHDGRDWVDSFDARQRGRLPTAIEVSIWLAPASPSPETTASGSSPSSVPPSSSWGAEDDASQRTMDDATPVDETAEPLSPPDRRRVIVVPDAAPAELLPAAPRRAA